MEFPISWLVFDEIYATFLHVQHTHEDIDQCFSCTSRRLKAQNTPMLMELHRLMRTAYNELMTVTALTSVVNILGLFESQSCLSRNIPPYSHYRYLHFTRPENGAPSCNVKHVRNGIDEDWAMLPRQKCSFFPTFPVFRRQQI